MNVEIDITPAGRLRAKFDAGDGATDRWHQQLLRALAGSDAAGLFTLARTQPPGAVSSSVAFFRDLACRCLAERGMSRAAALRELQGSSWLAQPAGPGRPRKRATRRR